jgi:LCP family protein required for cell wall assembly
VTEQVTDDSAPAGPAGEGRHGKPRRRRKRWVKVVTVIGAAVVVLLISAGATGFYLANKWDKNVDRVPNVFDAIPAAERPDKPAADALNILLVGSDVRAGGQTTGSGANASAGGQRSDTIMIVHIPANRQTADVVSIPRDSWVPIPGRGMGKVNWAFSYGGPALLVRTLEQLTDVKIDHYAHIDFEGFKSMTDALGGVDLPGAGHLDGASALTYVRERKTVAGGDFGRIKRQQAFLQALMSKTTSSFDSPLALGRLVDAVTQAVSVDEGLSSGDLRSLAVSMRGVRGSVGFHTVPTKGTGMVGDQSVVHLDPPADAKLWDAVKNDRMGSWTP